MMTHPLPGGQPGVCTVCGSCEFSYHDVLWQGLIDEWELSAEEAAYIDVQQGFTCTSCGANLRAMTLAKGICGSQGWPGKLKDWLSTESAHRMQLLEINDAFTLGRHWRGLPGYRFVQYPEVDMRWLPFQDSTFDLVVHSDALEHVEQPVVALKECHRVLKPGGTLAFTVPVIIGRLNRTRQGLPASYHGRPGDHLEDHRVETEFGADVWTTVLEAGFSNCKLLTLVYPASIAVVAEKE